MTRNELRMRAETYRRMAEAATPGERIAYLKLARNYYAEAGYEGLAAWCDRHMG